MNPTFKGGIHIDEHKNTASCPIETMPAPSVVKISLSQHSGAPMTATVKPGDHVYLGQPISVSEANFWCPVHASVSGTVKAIEMIDDASRASPVEAVVIENDFSDEKDPEAVALRPADEMSADEIIEAVRAAGVVGMGGAVFPTYAKMKNSRGRVKTLLINAAECEPYLTSDHRTMLESASDVIGGVCLLKKVLEAEKAVIAVEDNKPDAIEILKKGIAGKEGVEVRVLKTKYPQGEKSQIIYSLTKKEPTHGVRLANIGYAIFNVQSCAAVYRAARGIPLIERVVTVDGDCINTPKNVKARIGTPVRDVIEFCGGLKSEPETVVSGGPMMGAAQWNLDGVVTKSTSGLLFMSGKEKHKTILPSVCIRCGRCVRHCPMHLMPYKLAELSKAKKYDECEKYHVNDCMECGTCSYVCPGNVEIIQHIKVAKGILRAKNRKR